MLYEFKDIIDPVMLPSRRRYLSYYIVGLVDGEGCFSISVKKQDNTRFGWVIDPVFHVSQRKEGLAVLQVLRRFFNCGRIIPKPGQDETMIQYVVDARKHLAEKIIPFFMKHKPIIKWHAFHSFAEIVEALERGEHRSPEGFRKLVEKAYALSQDRKHTLDEILYELRKRVDASETIRWSP